MLIVSLWQNQSVIIYVRTVHMSERFIWLAWFYKYIDNVVKAKHDGCHVHNFYSDVNFWICQFLFMSVLIYDVSAVYLLESSIRITTSCLYCLQVVSSSYITTLLILCIVNFMTVTLSQT